MGQRRNQNIPGTKLKWKHNTTNSLGHIKSSSKKKINSSKCLIKKSKRAQRSDVMMKLKLPEK